MTTRDERSRQRREAIIDAAASRFSRHGYDRTRLADVARDVQLTDAGLLHHFATKRELFEAVLERREAAYQRQMATPPASFRAALDHLVAATSWSAQHPEHARFRVMLSGTSLIDGDPTAGRSRRYLDVGVQYLSRAAAAARDDGELQSDVDIVQLVWEILALNDGLREQWVIAPEHIDYVRMMARALDRIYTSVSAPRSPASTTGAPPEKKAQP